MSFQEKGFPDDRKKLDGFRLLDHVSLQDAQHSETKSTFNVRKSLAWDSAFFTSPGVLEPEELLQTTSSGATCNAVNLLGNEEEILLPSESLEPEGTIKFESCSYRKSLAWDNAFYTSPGVLDPEELSIVNKGFKKSESHQLPEIKEVWRSTESKSTIDSGSSPLESLEFELFEDTRSSMQKPASLKLKRGRGLQNVHRSKKYDASSQLVAGSGKFMPTASLKQPKIFSGLNPSATVATKRSSLGLKHAKTGSVKAAPDTKEIPKDAKFRNMSYVSFVDHSVQLTQKSNALAAGQCSTLTKKPCSRASSSIMPHSYTPSPKSSPSVSPASNETISESPMNSRSKVDYSLDDLAADGFTISNPSRFTKTNKDEHESDPCEMFTPKSTVYASSATSLDGWSSESSSSSMSQRSISRQIPFGSDTSQTSDTVHYFGHENQETSLTNQHMKPSGLRVPSPKNGFFDEEIALLRGRGSPFHSVVPSIVSQNEGANRYGKLKPPRNVDGKRNVQKALKRMDKESTKENEDPNTHCPGENVCIGQEDGDRENADYFKNQIESITKQVGITDLGCDVVMDLKAD